MQNGSLVRSEKCQYLCEMRAKGDGADAPDVGINVTAKVARLEKPFFVAIIFNEKAYRFHAPRTSPI